MRYQKYSQQVKYSVSKSGNPNIFPELKIPRTTANYWIRNKIHLECMFKPKDARKSQVELLRLKINKLQEENRKLNAQVNILTSYIKMLSKNNLIKVIRNNEIQEQITMVIKRYKDRNSIREILEKLNISFSKYKRWSSKKFRPCNNIFSQASCRSITYNELQKIKE